MASSVTSAATTATSLASSDGSSPTYRATPQGGILEGQDPSVYDAKNPITLFIVQAAVIIIFCHLLHFPLSRIRQPRVIAEVMGGILLGPSVMGRIPGFTTSIFPDESMPNLNLVANVGLVLFLFLVGLEADLRLVVSNWRIAFSVGAAGMIVPFGLGCGIAYGLFHQFNSEPGIVPIGFGVYMLFVGVAMAITAFPVLCRILTELKLLRTSVGTIVLSAGVGNDVVGWILLALCVALVNAGSGLTALWVFLTCTGFVLLVVFVVRPAFLWVLRRTGSLHNGPTPGVMTLTLLMVFISAWFTNIIGVHPIFGGFLVGLICPHDGGFAIKLTEKIEDLVTVFFLPLYFALSGLNTNLGLLDNGITWGYVIGVLAVAFFGKIVGGTIAARLCKLVWRESLTIGVLMSCKGLVELIVLNIGLQAQILSTRTFTIFVVMAVVTTFATTPMTSYLYPPWYQKKLEAWKRGEIDWDGNRLIETEDGSDRDAVSIEKLQNAHVRRLLVYLRLDSLSGLVTFVGLLGGKNAAGAVHKTHPLRPSAAAAANKAEPAVAEQDGEAADDAPAIVVRKRPVEVHGLRMVELTERTSSIMKVSELDDVRDPVVDVFHTFANLNNVAVSGGVVVVPHDSYAETLTRRASEMSSDLLLVPWGGNGEISEASDALMPQGPDDRFAHGSYHQFLSAVLGDSTCNLAVLVNNGFGGGQGKQAARPSMKRSFSALSLPSAREVPTAPVAERSHHIFFPFFGGPDDRAALRFVLQLAENVNVTVTILMLDRHPTSAPTTVTAPAAAAAAAAALTTEPKTQPSSEGTSVAETQPAAADTALDEDRAFFCSIRDSLPRALEARVVFHTIFTRQPLRDAFARAQTEVGQASRNAGDLVVVGRRSGAEPSTRDELTALLASLGRPSASGSEATHALGDAAEAMIVGKVKASVLVIRAATA